MKKAILLTAALLLGIMLSAQTQQGYVKTKGRMVNGQIVHGQGLKGATVSIKGRAAVVVNKEDGSFSFPIPEAQFRVDSVRKKGYQLVDMDVLSMTYRHSSNPIYLVMETPEQQLQDQLDAQREIRRTLQKQLQEKQDEIESLKEQQKISDEEYRQALQKLIEETEQNDQLIKDMVERYSKIDYDQMSEFDQRISELILNGDLIKADSMLRTKGDINERVEQYRKHEAINAKEKEELSQRQEQLQQSEALATQERDDLANDCYRKFEIFKMQHLNDSAAYYIELRATLDSTNIKWSRTYANFINEYLSDFSKSLLYYKKCINIVLSTDSTNYKELGELYSEIGSIYHKTGSFNKGYEYYNLALLVFLKHYDEMDIELAPLYTNIATVLWNCSSNGHDEDPLDYLEKSLSIRLKTYGEIHPEVANSYHNFGVHYSGIGDYKTALFYYNKALSIKEKLFGDNHLETAKTYSSIGLTYIELKQYDLALEFTEKALGIFLNRFDERHPEVSDCYNSLGSIYYELHESDKALEYYNKAIIIELLLFDVNNYRLSIPYSGMADVFFANGDNDRALYYYKKTLDILLPILSNSHPAVLFIQDKINEVLSAMNDKKQK